MNKINGCIFLQQWIETESIVPKVINKFKCTNLLEISNNWYHFQGFEDIDKYSINDNNDNKSESKISNYVYDNDYYNNNFIIMVFWRVATIIWKHQIPAIIRLEQEKDGQSTLIDKFAITIEQVLKKFGNEKLFMSDMPCASLFAGEIFQDTIQQYFENLMNESEWKSNNKKMSNMKPYVFDRA